MSGNASQSKPATERDEDVQLRKKRSATSGLDILYLLSFLDRSSIGNAKLYSMEADLHITDTQYLIALISFFFTCALFEMPSNILLKRLRPSRWLSFLMLMWGIIMTLHGVIRNYGDLITSRVLLGLFEAGLYPGVLVQKSELGTRTAIFFSAATVSGAFGGLLAAAIANMDGVGGKTAWAWIFILEGIITVIAGAATFWIIQDFPDTAKSLNDQEIPLKALQADQQFSAAGEKFKTVYVWQVFTDVKTWIGSTDGPLFAFSLFTPSIINQASFKATKANLLSVPVYAWACLVTCIIGILGDRLVGYIIFLASQTSGVSYFAVCLAASAWVSANTEGSGNLNGAVSSNVACIILAYITIGFISSLVMRIVLKRENERRERIKHNTENDEVHGCVEDAQKGQAGDRWIGFKYTL
ncbi:MFS general substrate transporter [Rickenella mellea]|uniref:MFS general substrate transporter n=1 Tax=Rickenella mellea TaxID=50990 RepID=A0A4Y7QNY1_9AGAM|nr:MFS general substrate transporter [Rickenella mellea]